MPGQGIYQVMPSGGRDIQTSQKSFQNIIFALNSEGKARYLDTHMDTMAPGIVETKATEADRFKVGNQAYMSYNKSNPAAAHRHMAG